MKKSFSEITSRLSELNRLELRELKAIIETLLELEVEEQKQVETTFRKNSKSKKQGAGHIEHKKIRGYGPYLYLRYWSGKKLKSVYIGKAKGK